MIHLKTTQGDVTVESVYGQDPETEQWLCPARKVWGLDSRQEMSPILEDRICYTATQTGSYESASHVAEKWGVPVDDSTIHVHVSQVGGRAEKLSEARVEVALNPESRPQVIEASRREDVGASFSLIIEMDAWKIRERGKDWGKKPADQEGLRVEWRDVKTAVIFRLDHRAENLRGRREIIEKYMVAYRGDPYEFGRRVFAEALRRGLNQAEKVFIVADGGVWIWDIVEDRFSDAIGVLDYYHASQHLWALGHEIRVDEDAVRQWVLPKLKGLKEGKIDNVIRAIQYAFERCHTPEQKQKVERELNYFMEHRNHADYARIKEERCPIGSGAVESGCSQLQGRFKQTGQFWTLPGERVLMALEIARRNHYWDEIWEIAA